QAEDGIRDRNVTGVQTCALPISFRLRLLSEPAPMAAGSVYDLALSWFGVPMRWRAFIREFDPPYRFVDVQVRGPYARWEHRHRRSEERRVGKECGSRRARTPELR